MVLYGRQIGGLGVGGDLMKGFISHFVFSSHSMCPTLVPSWPTQTSTSWRVGCPTAYHRMEMDYYTHLLTLLGSRQPPQVRCSP